jgi:hypothetical protein
MSVSELLTLTEGGIVPSFAFQGRQAAVDSMAACLGIAGVADQLALRDLEKRVIHSVAGSYIGNTVLPPGKIKKGSLQNCWPPLLRVWYHVDRVKFVHAGSGEEILAAHAPNLLYGVPWTTCVVRIESAIVAGQSPYFRVVRVQLQSLCVKVASRVARPIELDRVIPTTTSYPLPTSAPPSAPPLLPLQTATTQRLDISNGSGTQSWQSATSVQAPQRQRVDKSVRSDAGICAASRGQGITRGKHGTNVEGKHAGTSAEGVRSYTSVPAPLVRKPMVRINASQLASIAGLNPYTTQEESIRNMLGNRKMTCIADYGHKRKLSMLADVGLTWFNEVPESVEPNWTQRRTSVVPPSTGPWTSTASHKRLRLQEQQKIKRNKLALQSDPFSVQELHAATSAFCLAAKHHDTTSQHTVRSAVPVELSADDVYDTQTYSRQLMECAHYRYVLVGRVRVHTATSKQVIDIKRRKHRLFGTIKVYEQVQLEAYLYLTNTRHLGATQIETFKSQQDMHTYAYSSQLWSRIRTGLAVVLEYTRCT